MTTFLQLIDIPVDQKSGALRKALLDGGERRFDVDPGIFARVPGSPFAYWASQKILSIFQRLGRFENSKRAARQGGVNGDDFRWLRLWNEVMPKKAELNPFIPIAKGGEFARFYSGLLLLVHWDRKRDTFWAFDGLPHRPSLQPASAEYYFRPGLTWPRRTNGLSFRALPAGCIFADKGPAAFVEGDKPSDLLALCAIMNSQPFGYLISIQLARTELAQSYEVGLIQQTPIPKLAPTNREALAMHARRAWSLQHTLDTTREISHAFVLPAALRACLGPFDPSVMEAELVNIQSTIDDLAFRIYELDGDDRAAIEAWAEKSKTSSTGLDVEAEANDDTDGSNTTDAFESLRSWAVGVAFGRFDLRLATRERQPPPEPEPFDPLPTRSPGMVPEADKAQLPVRSMLVDDLGHTLDLTTQVDSVLERVGFAPENLETLNRSLARDFFPLHIKMYSKSRRKAPIYWQLATPSASYSIWLYIHAFSRHTLYEVQEIAETKLRREERKLESLRTDLGPNPKASDRKALVDQETFVGELRIFLDEVRRVAPLWNPDLDDGVIINFAPLWRLVPHHKPWQKELKATWDALCAGEYDWAHLAMHLWPERVVPKCATDRSLAIAHGLEDVFWVEGQDGKWKPRPTPSSPVEELVRERTTPAVKAALKSLLEAPIATGGGRRTKGARKERANA